MTSSSFRKSSRMVGFCSFVFLFASSNLLKGSVEAYSVCPRGYYSNADAAAGRRCSSCSDCPAGFGIRRECGPTSDTVCEACVAGTTYSYGWGQRKTCNSCSLCPRHKKVTKSCTITSDTECGECEVGFYWNSIYSKCEPCSWCFPDVTPRHEAYVVTTCVLPQIPANYHCAKLSMPPYHKPSWYRRSQHDLESSGDEISGSGDFSSSTTSLSADVNVFPTDDEDELIPISSSTSRNTEIPINQLTSTYPSATDARTRSSESPHSNTDIVMQQYNSLTSTINIEQAATDRRTFHIKPAPLMVNPDKKQKDAMRNSVPSGQSNGINYSLLAAVVGLSVFSVVTLVTLLILLHKYLSLRRSQMADFVSIAGTEEASIDSDSLLVRKKMET